MGLRRFTLNLLPTRCGQECQAWADKVDEAADEVDRRLVPQRVETMRSGQHDRR
jgi:hypothetical protein